MFDFPGMQVKIWDHTPSVSCAVNPWHPHTPCEDLILKPSKPLGNARKIVLFIDIVDVEWLRFFASSRIIAPRGISGIRRCIFETPFRLAVDPYYVAPLCTLAAPTVRDHVGSKGETMYLCSACFCFLAHQQIARFLWPCFLMVSVSSHYSLVSTICNLNSHVDSSIQWNAAPISLNEPRWWKSNLCNLPQRGNTDASTWNFWGWKKGFGWIFDVAKGGFKKGPFACPFGGNLHQSNPEIQCIQ